MPSPEYVAVTGYAPGVSVVDVWQLSAGRSAVHSVDPPEVKVTLPVASPGRPASDSVSAVPNGTLAGAADSVKDGSALVTMKPAPVAVVPL